MSERAALLLLDRAMERYEITREDVEPLIAMKLAVALDDIPPNPYADCPPGCHHLTDPE